MFVFVIIRPPPRSTRTDTLCPYTRSSDLVTPSVTPAGTVSVDGPVHVPPRSRRTRSPDADAASADEIDAPEATVRSVMSAAHPSEPSQIQIRSEEHTSELQSLMRHSSAVFCLQKKTINKKHA